MNSHSNREQRDLFGPPFVPSEVLFMTCSTLCDSLQWFGGPPGWSQPGTWSTSRSPSGSLFQPTWSTGLERHDPVGNKSNRQSTLFIKKLS